MKYPLPTYWRPENNNLGDLLTPDILTDVLGISEYDFELVQAYEIGKLLCVGSIIEHIRTGDMVWGSGIHRPERVNIGRKDVKIYSVRGPKTRDHLLRLGYDVPEVYGDPAILLPLFYNPEIKKKYKVGYIPHQVDYDTVKQNVPTYEDSTIINITNEDWRITVDKILECEMIVSSSLHGIIISEAYGIPAIWSIHTGGVWGGDFKFQDYFQSTGRYDCKPFTLLETPKEKIKELQDKLIESGKELCQDLI